MTSSRGNNDIKCQLLTLKGLDNSPRIVLITGDEEYRSEEALPQLAKILSHHHGFNCQVLFPQDPDFPGVINPNYRKNIARLEVLETADLMIIFTRFRDLPENQMAHIDRYLKLGKPVFGIRTATHAFSFESKDANFRYHHYCKSHKSKADWDGGFGKCVLGQNWIAHHGRHGHQSTRGILSRDAEGHAILNGINDGDVWGPTDVYRVNLPLPSDWQPLILGQVVSRQGEFDESDLFYGMKPTDRNLAGPQIDEANKVMYDPNHPLMPIAWTKPYKIPGGQHGRAVVLTIGASVDMLSEGTRRLMVNAVFWALNKKVPEKAIVDLVGNFLPTSFKFMDDAFWRSKNVQISSLIES